MRWALVNWENIVVNVVIWAGGDNFFDNYTTVQLAEDEPCDIGWVYDPSPMANPRFSKPVSGE